MKDKVLKDSSPTILSRSGSPHIETAQVEHGLDVPQEHIRREPCQRVLQIFSQGGGGGSGS
eukprot:scaffold5636_cov159-Ochromonas_danica.AAC.24